MLLYDVDSDAYEFLSRSLSNPRFIHSLSPLLLSWQKKSLTSYPKQVHVFIHGETLDIACFERGEMLFVNSFDYSNENDIVYYINYTCKQLDVNQLEDNVFFCGNEAKCLSAMSVVKKYIRQVDYLSPQVSNYTDATDMDISLDVVTLMECAL